jgi:predicted NUDIX family phosphoesterase/dephospho-CoA kinase
MGKFLDAAEIVLRRGGEPMIVSKLTEQALSDRLLDGCNGDTPIQTMKAKLSVDIKVNGARSRFKRIGPGLFALRDSTGDEYVARPFQKQLRASENVLVFATRLLRQTGWFHGISRDVGRYLPLLRSENTKAVSRVEAETNLTYKQVISYVLVRRRGAVLRFVRGVYSSVQSFLKGRHCIGFGGHAEGGDITLFDTLDSGYLNSLKRELTEELKIDESFINDDNLQLVGVLNDDSSLVGKLHFAFVHILDLDDLPEVRSAKALKREKSINQLRFVPVSRLGDEYERYEYWSKLCIQEFFKGSVRIQCRIHPVRNFSLAKHSTNVAVVGTVGSGKTEASRMLLEQFGYDVVNTGEIVQEILGASIKTVGRGRVQNLAQTFIQSPTGPETLAEAIYQAVIRSKKERRLIDGLRNVKTFELLRRKLGGQLTLIYVDSTVDNAFAFYRSREDQRISFEQFVDIWQHPVELDVGNFLPLSNIVIYNHGSKRSYQETVMKYFKQEVGR